MKIYYTERTKTVADKLSWLEARWVRVSGISDPKVPPRMEFLYSVFLVESESLKAQMATEYPTLHIVSIEAIESPEYVPGRNDTILELPRSFDPLSLDAAFDGRIRSEGRI